MQDAAQRSEEVRVSSPIPHNENQHADAEQERRQVDGSKDGSDCTRLNRHCDEGFSNDLITRSEHIHVG
jgi:hypothetical protein